MGNHLRFDCRTTIKRQAAPNGCPHLRSHLVVVLLVLLLGLLLFPPLSLPVGEYTNRLVCSYDVPG